MPKPEPDVPSPLAEKIAQLIEATGPLSVADYMATCLFDPQHGYYTTREPFGASGDFVTAPEISQMFGELVGVWLLSAWQALGRPRPVLLTEIGPGRGTLMSDILRTLARIGEELAQNAEVALVETSPRLADLQRKTLAAHSGRIAWHQSLATLPGKPLLVVANELFDAIPLRQYVRAAGTWMERAVGLGADGALAWTVRPGAPDPAMLPPGAASAPDGAIAEIAPARTALMEEIACRIAENGGAGLFFDYGYLEPALGDTFQGIRRHTYADPLSGPGATDLTAHVDFSALAETAKAHGLAAYRSSQGRFLLGMGLVERAGQLGAKADQATRRNLQDAVDRLAGPDAMGELFKVLCVAPRGVELPFFGLSRSD